MNQRNRIREVIESDVALGVQVATVSPTVIELCAEIGFDYVWLDLEHKGPSPYDSDAVEDLARIVKGFDTELVVRIPNGSPDLIRKVLDAGLRNVVIPQLRTPEQFRQAIQAARFTYDGEPGRRGSGIARANTWGRELEGYPQREDESVCIGFVLENRDVVENADEILSLPEIGFVLVGMGDLSVSTGHPLDRDHPDIVEQEETLIEVCETYDVPMGKSVSSADAAVEAVEDGYRLIAVGRDVALLESVLGDRLDHVRNHT